MLGFLQFLASAVEPNTTPHPNGEVGTPLSQLAGAPRLGRRQVLLDADEFVTKHDLHDTRDLIRKGALLCHEPHDFVRGDDLSEEEIASLHREGGNRSWDLSWDWTLVTRAGTFSCLAGILCVLLQLSLLRTNDFSLFQGPNSHEYFLRFLESLIPLLEFPLAVLLSRRIGRRKALCVASIFAICSTVGRLNFRPRPILLTTRLAARLLAGIAMAMISYAMPLYLADHSQASSRGSTMANWLVAFSFWNGMLQGPGRDLVIDVRNLQEIKVSWVHIVIIPISALLILSLPYMAVESPHRSIVNGQIKTALQTLYKSRPSKFIAARDLYRIHAASISRSKTRTRESSTFDYSPAQQPQDIPTISTFLANPTLRRATVSSVTIMLTRVLITPAQMVDLSMPEACKPALRDSFIKSIQFTFILICLLKACIDGVGRRRRLLPSLMLLEFLLFFVTPPDNSFYPYYTALSTGVAAICTIYAAEVFPHDYRETGFAITIVVYNTVFVFVRAIGAGPWAYRSYFSVCFLMPFVLVYFFMRETRKVAFEDMEQVFEARTRDIASYRVKVVWPYLFRRYILWRQVNLESFEESRYSGGGIGLGLG